MVRRKNTTQSGAPAQPSAPIAGQTYGLASDQQQLAQAMPTPDNSSAVATAAAPPAPAGAPAAGPPNIQQLLALAAGQGAGAGLLTNGTARPNEPVTTGLPIGPGAGPSAIGFMAGSTPGQRFLRSLSQQLGGDPYLDSLADRVAR